MLRRWKVLDLDIADESLTSGDGSIALLIGADYYWQVVTGEIIRLSDSLVAAETIFGWTVQGPGNVGIEMRNDVGVMCIGVDNESSPVDVGSLLQSFWQLEHLGVVPHEESDVSNDKVLQEFRSTARLEEGRYVVRLPRDAEKLPALRDNKILAIQRLNNITRKLLRQEDLIQEYDSTIRQYLNDGHAERVTDPESVSGPLYYMPHHAVIKRDRETTKVRIVFDASSKAAGSISLNESLHAGPNLNPDVLQLLLQFRTYPVALTADIEKAFLQIVLHEADRDSLRFLWYASPPKQEEPLPQTETWRVTRVPFGARSSPFLLAATIRHHLALAEERYPDIAPLLSSHFYVDDLVVGADTVEAATTLYRDVRAVLQEVGMRLVKWTSSDSSLQATFETDGVASSQASSLKKVLGLSLDIGFDRIRYSLKSFADFLGSRTDTKRYVLQAVSRLYDLLGHIAPYVLTAKTLLQEIWLRNLNWDDCLPDDLKHKWLRWCEDADMLPAVSVPRRLVRPVASLCKVSKILHVFSDASPQAYGAVVYLVSYHEDGHSEANLVIAKTRVAPVKTITLP